MKVTKQLNGFDCNIGDGVLLLGGEEFMAKSVRKTVQKGSELKIYIFDYIYVIKFNSEDEATNFNVKVNKY